MFAVLHLADFWLQAIVRADPALRGQPVALLAEAERGATIHSCTPEARAAGVGVGFSVPRAQARCPSLVVRTRQPDLEREAEAALLAVAFAVSPHVELTSPGVCTLDITRVLPPRRQPALQQAMEELADLGLATSAGFATTPLLALYAARRAAAGQITEGSRDFLAPLPLAVAEASPELVEILHAWGVRTLGQLTALTKADVTHRLGRDGLALWERAAGETTRPLNLATPAREFTAAFDCEHELETLEPLLFILRRFVDRLALELRNAHFAALALELTLHLADETRHDYSIRLPEAVTDADLLFRALHTYLETLRTTAAIEGVRLRVVPGRSTVRQHGLFDGGLRDPHGFADTLARVTALVGPDRVGTPACIDTHRPDSFKLATPPAALPPVPQGFAHPPRGLPLRRFRPPAVAKVELAGRVPAFVWTDRVRGAVEENAGPWHGSGDWWQRDTHWQREEWDVALAGGVYRLVRTPDGWFLEGEYD
ncbi:MAG TPA: DNA polymerase Y family protein [Candidatus Didemnitutus sp.]|nr:DNA polymerase Y family protein [Candidatus Didemnitutus sp.]